MVPSEPKITIVTPLLNRAAFLPDALSSVAAQSRRDIEHIVIDGGSTDCSQDVAAAFGACVINLPGSSIYEAINAGVERARGSWLCLLNSDDRLPPNGINAAAKALERNPTLDFVRGRASIETQSGLGWTTVDDGTGTPPKPTLRTLLFGASNINACLFRLSFMRRVGPFNTALRIAADREWLARAMLSGACVDGVDEVLYIYRTHDGSLTIGHNRPKTRAWVTEHLSFAKQLLAENLPDASHRAVIRAFFAKETAHLCALSVAAGDLGAALRSLRQGFATVPFWPVHAIIPLASIARRRLGVGSEHVVQRFKLSA